LSSNAVAEQTVAMIMTCIAEYRYGNAHLCVERMETMEKTEKIMSCGGMNDAKALRCPVCSSKTDVWVRYTSVLTNVPVWCRHCRRSYDTDYSEGVQTSKT